MADTCLSISSLTVRFGAGAAGLAAVDDVSLDVARGEILALVGESGSGKSLTSLSVIGLLPFGAMLSGRIVVDGSETSGANQRDLEDIRGARVGMIFQEPMTSLNPVLTIRRQITEGLARHRGQSGAEAKRVATAALEDVGIVDAERVMRQYPHHLSGGMRQRVMIAAALALEPALLIADEPTTALDVTVQAQVLDLLVDLKTRHNSGVLLITHDIGVVAETADRVAVMRKGSIVEQGRVDEIIRNPQHPYTRELLASHLSLDDVKRKLVDDGPSGVASEQANAH